MFYLARKEGGYQNTFRDHYHETADIIFKNKLAVRSAHYLTFTLVNLSFNDTLVACQHCPEIRNRKTRCAAHRKKLNGHPTIKSTLFAK